MFMSDKLQEPLTKCLRRVASQVFDQSFLQSVVTDGLEGTDDKLKFVGHQKRR